LLNAVGETSIAARGEGELPPGVAQLVRDQAVHGNSSVFSVADEHVRQVVDALDDGGWRLLSVSPKRDSLEDYFARLLGESTGAADVLEAADASGGDGR
jgi:hypothetical protein